MSRKRILVYLASFTIGYCGTLLLLNGYNGWVVTGLLVGIVNGVVGLSIK